MSENSLITQYSCADETRAKILHAAKKLFVEHGYAGTSIGKIAALAEVNHSLIFHHFKNKQNLWIEVKQNIVQSSDNKAAILPELGACFTTFLKKLIFNSLAFYKNNPDIVYLMNWQRIESKQHSNIGITNSHDMQLWIHAIRHYQNIGSIRNELRPEFVISFVLSIVSSAALDPNMYIKEPKDLKAYLDFSLNAILKGIS